MHQIRVCKIKTALSSKGVRYLRNMDEQLNICNSNFKVCWRSFHQSAVGRNDPRTRPKISECNESGRSKRVARHRRQLYANQACVWFDESFCQVDFDQVLRCGQIFVHTICVDHWWRNGNEYAQQGSILWKPLKFRIYSYVLEIYLSSSEIRNSSRKNLIS